MYMFFQKDRTMKPLKNNSTSIKRTFLKFFGILVACIVIALWGTFMIKDASDPIQKAKSSIKKLERVKTFKIFPS